MGCLDSSLRWNDECGCLSEHSEESMVLVTLKVLDSSLCSE